jgi:hypothetical protein
VSYEGQELLTLRKHLSLPRSFFVGRCCPKLRKVFVSATEHGSSAGYNGE